MIMKGDRWFLKCLLVHSISQFRFRIMIKESLGRTKINSIDLEVRTLHFPKESKFKTGLPFHWFRIWPLPEDGISYNKIPSWVEEQPSKIVNKTWIWTTVPRYFKSEALWPPYEMNWWGVVPCRHSNCSVRYNQF
jgi:hypothetical protein